MTLKELVKDFGKAALITTGIIGAMVANDFAKNYEKFGRVLPVKSIEIPYQPSERNKIVSKTGRDWNGDGRIDEIITVYEIPEEKFAGMPFRYSVSRIPVDSKFYKNIKYIALD